jgi:hypothetical protein
VRFLENTFQFVYLLLRAGGKEVEQKLCPSELIPHSRYPLASSLGLCLDNVELYLIFVYLENSDKAMKKNEILSFAGKCMELENIIQSEVSQTQKTKNRMFSLICGL